MKMKPGQAIRRFSAGSREVVIRAPRSSDLDGMLNFINSLVDEDTFILANKRIRRDKEKKYVKRILSEIRSGESVHLVAEVDGKIVAKSEISRHSGKESHMGTLGISVLEGYREMGIGSRLMSSLLDSAKKAGLKMVELEVFANNPRAMHVYKKLGFRQVGRVPRKLVHKGRYVDAIVMSKWL